MKSKICPIIAMLSLSTTGVASEKVPVKEGFEVMDMHQFDKIKSPSGKKPNGSVQLTTVCRDKSGKEFLPADVGFQTCVVDSQKSNGSEASTAISIDNRSGK